MQPMLQTSVLEVIGICSSLLYVGAICATRSIPSPRGGYSARYTTIQQMIRPPDRDHSMCMKAVSIVFFNCIF